MRLLATFASFALLSACATTPQDVPPPPPRPVDETTQVPPSAPAAPRAIGSVPAPRIMEGPGLGGIIREPAAVLTRRFGEPRLNVREGDMRKLQFSGQACVLDVFLYPLAPGAEPVATWVEARRASDGAAVDRLACIQALSSR
ncbi:hypothetical protein [Aurantiacibacter sediminis]|uniref:Uncharacterized protein n=1 Tax=Aurantiacibacter sediminis TaxID=2793064 RepID=A0ABS0N2I3_9SPHN|nr:hypothetical protein [Aurantiacibacter sediminis]MBH5321461.1 hypothetical protein [Aurantiacibacter sediminis]